jgi:hypothetical protein
MKDFLRENSKCKIVAKLSIISVTTLLMMFAGNASFGSYYHSVYAAAKNATSSSSSSTSKGGGSSTKNSTFPTGSSTFLNVITKVKGGTAKPSDFTISVSGKSPSPKSFSGSSSGTSVTLKAGKYKVTGAGPTGYTSSYSSGCSGTASGGTPVKCTVSNKYTAAAPTPAPNMNLTVIMKVDNTKGGTLKPSDFYISVDCARPETCTPHYFKGSSDGTVVAARDGPYTVNVPGDYVGYSFTKSTLCQSVAHAGYSIKCTISASYAPPAKLSVIMNVDNTKGGTKKPRDFYISVSGDRPSPGAFFGSSSGTSVILNAGKYKVAALELSGYTSSYSSGCSGTASEVATITCTISESYVPPADLFVTLNVDNTKGGTKKPGDFLISVSGNPSSPYPEYPLPKSFYGSSSGTSVTLNPGQFTVVAGAILAYDIKPSPECSGTASEGATIRCTITASYVPAKLSVTLNVDNTKGGTKKPSDFHIYVVGNSPSPALFLGSSSGTSVTLNTGNYRVDLPSIPFNYSLSASPECSGTASEGATFKCTISASYSPPLPPPPSSVKIHFIIIDRANCGKVGPIDYGTCPALGHTEIYVAPRPGEVYPIARFVAHSNHEYVELPGKDVGQKLYASAEPTPSLVVGNFKYDKFIFYIPPPNQPNHQCGNYYSSYADCYFTMPRTGIDIEIDTYWHNTMTMPSAK